MKTLFSTRTVGASLLLSMILLFSLNFTSAAIDTTDVTEIFTVDKVIPFTQPCTNNGTYCGSSATCNYTFYDRNNIIIQNNVPAVNVGDGIASIWRYNITQSETGFYKADICCQDPDNNAQACETLRYQVTGDGFNDSIGFYILIIGLAFGLVIFGLWLSDPTITMLGAFGLFFMALYVLFNGLAGTRDPVTTWGIGLILLGVATYISIRTGMEVING